MTTSPLLSAQSITKIFHGQQGPIAAVKDISFSLNKGEIVGFMGPNGAGKSTTMRILAGFIAPTSGDATINGYSILSQRESALSHLGYLAEMPGLFEDLTPLEYLSFLADAHQLTAAKKASQIDLVSRLTRCNTFMHRTLGELSKGMKQRVHFAGALVHDPAVLILDEPTDGLDPNQKHEMRLVLKELAKTKAILVSTHILEEAEAICNRVIVVNNGHVVVDTTPEELARHGRGDIQIAFRVLTQNKNQHSISAGLMPRSK